MRPGTGVSSDAPPVGLALDLSGRVAVVTGTSKGIGWITAQDLAARGAHVVCASRDLPAAERCAAEIRKTGGNGIALRVDVRDEESVAAMTDGLHHRFDAVDILVNNAGIGKSEEVEISSRKSWEEIISTNLTCPFLCTKHLLPVLSQSGRGAVVNIGSILGIVCMPDQAAYSAAKAALHQLTRQMALDLASKNIRVNCVAPGFVRTEMYEHGHPEARKKRMQNLQALGRVGYPAEIAYAVAFLSSDLASFMTGAVILVDGGLTAQFGFGVIEHWEANEVAAPV